MPIDIRTFEEATDGELREMTNPEKVLRFLIMNDDKAFLPSEIADAAGVKKNSIGTVLRRLEDRDLVRHKGDFWAIGDEEHVREVFSFHQTVEYLNEQFEEEDIDEWREHAAEEPDE
jgi:Mn-dependent DtxR family transcriptional regulator